MAEQPLASVVVAVYTLLPNGGVTIDAAVELFAPLYETAPIVAGPLNTVV